MAKLTQLSNYENLCERIRSLVTEGLSAECIAQRLNQEGYHPPKRRESFSRQGVQDLMRRLGLCQQRSRSKGRDGLGEAEWWLPEERPCNWHAGHHAVQLGTARLGKGSRLKSNRPGAGLCGLMKQRLSA